MKDPPNETTEAWCTLHNKTTVLADPSHAQAARKPMLWISVNKVEVVAGAEKIKKRSGTSAQDNTFF
jgi:hypothetical protein